MSKRMSLLRNSIYTIMAVALTLTSCNRQIIYSHYEPIDTDGWGRHDTICFMIPYAEEGQYAETLGLRAIGTYPYRNLTLIVNQKKSTQEPNRVDTINCEIVGEKGILKGSGTSIHQIDIPLTTVHLQAGDTLNVSICHHMSREMLPGITDIGFTLKKLTE